MKDSKAREAIKDIAGWMAIDLDFDRRIIIKDDWVVPPGHRIKEIHSTVVELHSKLSLLIQELGYTYIEPESNDAKLIKKI